jgi:hypothetical protein
MEMAVYANVLPQNLRALENISMNVHNSKDVTDVLSVSAVINKKLPSSSSLAKGTRYRMTVK